VIGLNTIKRKNIKRVDAILQSNAMIEASLSKETPEDEVISANKIILKNKERIKNLCPLTYYLINLNETQTRNTNE
tara:strand:+ start:848 stop:1075 length:228 start_codon:yes stop_codon:yes gene_type:complete